MTATPPTATDAPGRATAPAGAAPAATAGEAADAGGDGGAGAFLRWGAGTYLGTVAVLVASVVAVVGWPFTYVLDDPAIHLSIARRLVEDGTWGVAAGRFESASSAPLWTLLLAPFAALPPAARDLAPLALNVVAGLGALAALAGPGAVLQPSRRRPLDAAATVALVVVVLFLPGLAVVGMEHTLHVALVLAVVALASAPPSASASPSTSARRWPAWLPYALLVAGTLTRFETAFVAAGLALGLLVDGGRGAWRRAAATLAAPAGAIAAVAAVNSALGGGLLPNSVLAKGQGTGPSSDGLTPTDVVHRLAQDPLVVTMFVLAVGYLVATWGRTAADRPRRGRPAAFALAAATLAHVTLADVGWFDRYQAYLLALGAHLGLVALGEAPADARRRALAAAIAVAAVFGVPKLGLLVDTPSAAGDMAGHHRQAARFLDRYYDDQPIATDQLGYISLLHDGPITDLAGLGDYEVLQRPDGGIDQWDEITAERGDRVAVIYDVSAFRSVPRGWVLGGTLRLDGKLTTAVSSDLLIFATSVEELEPLQDHLAAFADEVPDGVELRLNENAPLQAMALADAS